MREIHIGLLGCGVVGTGVVELVRRSAPLVAERTGVLPRISRVAVRDRGKERRVERELVCDAETLLADRSIDVVVELIGGVEPARTLVLRAIESGRHVVTANKALLAAHGAEILAAAARRGVRVAFEASVCGGLPVLRAITQGLVANRIDRIWGIVNGTSNFILSAMEDGATFAAALAAAQACGFAEPDPSLDIDGHDALQKLQILVGLAFGCEAGADSVRVEGIRGVTREDLAAARERGLALRHLVQADLLPEGLWLSVGPVLLPERHALAWSRNEFNALLVRGDAVGETVFTGKGAGPMATASAVLSDVVDVATSPVASFVTACGGSPVTRAADRRCPFVVRMSRADAETARAAIVRAGAEIADVDEGPVTTRIDVAECSEAALRSALAGLDVLAVPVGGRLPAGRVRAA